jgi:hypothetical protein
MIFNLHLLMEGEKVVPKEEVLAQLHEEANAERKEVEEPE